MKVCEGVYSYVWRGVFVNNCNMFYFGEPLNMLFDPGLKDYVDVRFEEMKKDGLDPKDIKQVICTHCHPDHFEGVEYFIDKKTPIGMHKEEISFLNTEGPKFFEMFGMKFPEINFDTQLENGTWEVEGTELEIFQTPGHSPGSACIYWKEKKALVCGDLIFKESVGRTDFPGGDGKELIDSIQKISELDIEIIMPGHMEIITGADNVKRNFDVIKQHIFPMI